MTNANTFVPCEKCGGNVIEYTRFFDGWLPLPRKPKIHRDRRGEFGLPLGGDFFLCSACEGGVKAAARSIAPVQAVSQAPGVQSVAPSGNLPLVSVGAAKPKPKALALPVRIYETVNQMDDYQAKDMKCGDLDAQTLRGLFGIELETVSTKVNPVTLQLLTTPMAHALSPYAIPKAPKAMPLVTKGEAASLMFDEFRALAKVFSFQGPYKGVIDELITHMQGNSGEPFRSPLLDQALKEQILNDQSDQSSLLSIKKVISRYMNSEYSLYPLEYKNKFKDEIGRNSILPKFDRWIERTNGLVVSVHDTWATHITLESLEVTGNCYRARVHYRIQDHFGLDNADVLHPIYRQARIFRLWFALQRWDKFGYKPFITEMNATVEISGGRGE